MPVSRSQARRRAIGRYVARIEFGVENPLVVGERGAGLARMHRLGLPVPGGFTLTTDAWRAWQRVGAQMPLDLSRALRGELVHLVHELATGDATGGPIRLAVRPSPPVHVADGSPERLLVLELDTSQEPGGALPRALPAQVREAVEAIWRGWDPEPAYAQLRTASAPRERGIAVVVQRAIESSTDGHSGHGRLITRDPETGLPGAVGCFGSAKDGSLAALRLAAPQAYAALSDGGVLIESAYRDMCEIEFAIDDGELWLLDARAAERTPAAAIRVAVDLVEEGLIELDEALERVSLSALDRLQQTLAADAGVEVPQLGRLLMWCDERRRVAVEAHAPAGWPSVSTRKQALAVDAPSAVIDLSPMPTASSSALRSVVRATLGSGANALALQLPDAPIERDLRLPPAPWRAIVASPRHTWAARLLAARARISEAPDTRPVLLEKSTTR
jgi:hypothetical protein